jgi:phosphatidylserine decarboxylase
MKISNTKKKWGIILLLLIFIATLAFYPVQPQAPIQYYERETGELKTEKVAGENWLVWLYYNPVGEATLWAFAKRKVVSTIYGKIMDCRFSAKKIPDFIEDFDIDMSIAKKQEFDNFNDFFTRKLKDGARPIDTSDSIVVSPADGKILAYDNISNSDFIIKGFRFDVASFLNNTELAQKYHNGDLLIIRLAPPDYHRFHFPVGGYILLSEKIDGDYYSVNPIALLEKPEIFFQNKREYSVVSNPLFGEVVMAEVGATMVGSIVQTYESNNVKKGDEKGYFKFGGSTVVLLFEKDKINIDDDLLTNTAKGYETTTEMGKRIGFIDKTKYVPLNRKHKY